MGVADGKAVESGWEVCEEEVGNGRGREDVAASEADVMNGSDRAGTQSSIGEKFDEAGRGVVVGSGEVIETASARDASVWRGGMVRLVAWTVDLDVTGGVGWKVWCWFCCCC